MYCCSKCRSSGAFDQTANGRKSKIYIGYTHSSFERGVKKFQPL